MKRVLGVVCAALSVGSMTVAGASAASVARAAAPTASAGEPGTYVAVAPARVLDTRTAKPAAAQSTVTATLPAALVPAGVGSVALTVTAVSPTAGGYLTVYAAGTARPSSSNLNFVKAQSIANSVITRVGAGGKVSIFNGSAGTTQVLVDVTGYFRAGTPVAPGAFTPVAPTRLLDTRATAPVAGSGVATVALPAGSVPAGVRSVVLNVTAVNPAAGGYLTVYAAGTARPGSSNLNFAKAQTISVLVVAPVGASAKVAIFNGSSGTTNVIADLAGYFLPGAATAGGAFTATTPTRLLDTRATTALAGHGVQNVNVVGGAAHVPNRVSAVVLSVSAVAPAGTGYLTAYASGTTRTATSSLSFTAGRTIANLVIAPVGSDGRVLLYNGSTAATHLVVDLAGYMVQPPVTAVLTATATSPDAIDLAWTVPSGGVVIRRMTGTTAPAAPDDGVPVAALAAGTTAFHDTSLDPEQTYSYSLFASDAAPSDSPLATATAALPRWSAGALPLAVDGPGGAAANSVQCFTDGTCVAVGFSVGANNSLQGYSQSWPMVSVRTGGRWATQVLQPPVGSQYLGIGSLSCVNSGYCVALGDGVRAQATLVETLRDGRWTSTVIPSPADGRGLTLRSVSCVAVDVCRAVGSYTDDRGALHFVTEVLTDGAWERSDIPVPSASGGTPVLTDFACASSTDCLASGIISGSTGAGTFVERLSGTQWEVDVLDPPQSGAPAQLGRVSCAGGTCSAWGTFAPSTGDDHIYRVQPAGSGWQTVVLPAVPGRHVVDVSTLSCPPTAPEGCSVLAGGQDSTGNSGTELLTYGQSAWTVSAALIGPRGTEVVGFFGLSCPASGQCTLAGQENTGRGGATPFAIDVAGGVQRSQQIPALNPAGSLSDVDCPVAGTCLATGGYDSYTGDSSSLVRMLSNGRWADVDPPVPPSDSHGFGAVSCPTTTFCAVAGVSRSGSGPDASSGLVDTWNGSTWTTTSLGIDFITHLDCPAAGSCVAVGTEVPRGPLYHPSVQIALTLKGGTWTRTALPLPTSSAVNLNLRRIACADTTHCTAVGRYESPADAEMLVETMTAGTWTATTVPLSATGGHLDTFTDVACPATTQCVIAAQYTDADNYVRDAVLTGTEGRWSQQTLPTYGSAGRDVSTPRISCPSVGRCTLVDEYSEPWSIDVDPIVYTLTGGTWLMELLDQPDGALGEIVSDVSCAASMTCVAVGAAQLGVAQLPVAITFA